jgi:hypothetical protein
MVENLVQAVAGQDYPSFVRQNFLTPLGMTASRYMVQALPAGSYARSCRGTTLLPLYPINVYATGGLFSTPSDLARLALLHMDGGRYGSTRILSAASVAAMAQDQRLGSFDPVPCSLFAYGLGWDTVAYPGLAAVGVRVLQKGGDLEGFYGATLFVAPEERLAVVVLGASNHFNSGAAAKIAERILLRALVDRGRISAMPAQLPATELPVQALAPGDRAAYAGFYTSGSATYRLSFGADDALTVDTFGTAWSPTYVNLKLRSDGWFAADGTPNSGVRLFTRQGRLYFALRAKYGYGHYRVESMYGQQVAVRPDLSAAWTARAADAWLPVADVSADLLQSAADPSFRFKMVEGLGGYLLGDSLFGDASPVQASRLDGMFLTLPDGVRDLKDASTETWNGETWLRLGAGLFRPLSTVPALPAGASTVTIGTDGFTEWRQLPASGQVSIAGAACWSLHGPDLSQLAVGTQDATQAFTGTGPKWLALFGARGAAITLQVTAP